jgi:hemolysin activation/secretion protein
MSFPLRFLACCLLAMAALAAMAATGESPPAAARFDIMEYQVDGNSVLPDLAIERAVYAHLGPGRGFADVEAARAALEKAYQDAGYLSVSVSIPEQKVEEAIVRLLVVEGQVEKLKVSGNRYYERGEIRAQVPELAPGNVPYFPAMQAQLGELGRSPDRRVTPLLRPGKAPGKLEVELAVEDQLPFHGSVELNNRQSPDTTAQRLEASLRYDNLFQKQHSAGLSYVVSPENTSDVKMLSGYYTLPLGRGRSLSLSALHSDSNVLSAESGVVGKGDTYGVHLSSPLPGLYTDPSFFHSIAAGFDVKNFKETSNVLGADRKVSPLRYTPFALQYTAGDFAESGDLLGNLYYVFGVRGASQRLVDCQGALLDQFECRRAGAPADFSILRGDLTYSRRLLGWEFSARGDFQFAGQPLVSNEQFLAGGMDSVRGYLEGEAAGDVGWRLRTEVKTPAIVDFASAALRGVAFFDTASLSLQDPLPGQTSGFHLMGSGVGLRLSAAKNYQLSLDWGHALRSGPRTASGESRLHVRLGATF